ncbi:phage putative head morphogenesis protein, SPP1 gp7 family [Alkalithermobacter thermoalcaliphilus JW-YL-7 = DSM 7308]|uniref:Phage head morphogenesis protein, SPP1 gp7 family n=1 Tax=Alkalithermobacter thermoalcaliphilus JW-YL-7 = DSM 7308 TaxID=1121328 RepID=A0A150FPH6_CLOPD|nr:phage head morphogenesis protein, SPP1 gp7 family [[Clostridium] paradoxum JW-YL-7 = DSM 7308]SHK50242.1 phage putative head morphogenesis protein, SPP1 gp7 family [[Clostridium] paradoxum JW-YL-7 = DSM 7308]
MNKEIIKKHEKLKEKQRKEIKKIEKELIIAYALLFKEIKEIIRETEEKAGEWNYEELNKYNRLNKTIDEVNKKIDKNRNKEIALITGLLILGYKRSWEDSKELIKSNKEVPTLEKIKKNIADPWSGLSFSERIWDNQHKLKRKLKSNLIKRAVDKDNVNKVIKDIEKELNVSYNNAKRLINTEYTRVNYIAEIELFKEEGVTEVMYNATLDNSCSECSSMHGKVFRIETEPALPRHANCACFYTPVLP